MTNPYRLSFTTGGLFVKEAPTVVACYLETGDWYTARNMVRQDNLLQVRTAAAATRISKEVVARLEMLDEKELNSLQTLGQYDLAYLLWAVACRRFMFIRDFAVDVLREHYLLRRRQLTVVDFESFYNSKALWHEELDNLADSTRRKLRQVLFRMMREANLLSDQHIIQPALPGPGLARLLARRGQQEFLIFPVTDHDIQRWFA